MVLPLIGMSVMYANARRELDTSRPGRWRDGLGVVAGLCTENRAVFQFSPGGWLMFRRFVVGSVLIAILCAKHSAQTKSSKKSKQVNMRGCSLWNGGTPTPSRTT